MRVSATVQTKRQAKREPRGPGGKRVAGFLRAKSLKPAGGFYLGRPTEAAELGLL